MRVLLALTCAALLSGCGLTTSPADGLTFTAPSGWQGSPGILGFMQFWHPSSSSEEMLMLFRSPKELSAQDVFSNAKLKDARVEREEKITICGNQPAMYFKGRADSSTGNGPSTPHNVEMTMTNTNNATYFALYIYALASAPNAEAERAIHQLCVKR